MHAYYSSCLWQKGDILLVDNRQVVHARMPGAGPRLIRDLIGNPLKMDYTSDALGSLICKNSREPSLGYYLTTGTAVKQTSRESPLINVLG